MLKRYPHTAQIVVVKEEKNPGGIDTLVTYSFDVEGRFSPAASRGKGIDYRAKFYCRSVDYVIAQFLEAGLFPEELFSFEGKSTLVPFSLDGHTFVFNGKSFEILMLHNYQAHCEIWLE